MRVKNNLDKIIYEHIVDSLILGEYSMGQTILLDEFAEKYEVSRTPVTQAVRLLTNDGLLETMTNGRVRVPEFNEEQMRKICEVRLLMEQYVITMLCSETDNNKEAFYERLANVAEKGVSALTVGDKLEFNKKDLEFHTILMSGYDNEYLASEYKRIQGKFVVANYLIKSFDERDFRPAAESHVELVKLLREQKKTESLVLIKEHIYSSSSPF